MGWLRDVIQRKRMERDIEEELAFHVDMKTQEFIAAGADPQSARAEAERHFGRRTAIRESAREAKGLHWIDDLTQDIRLGIRLMHKNAGFTAVAVTALALGTGANTAMFSVAHTVLLKSLPFHDPDRITHIAAGRWSIAPDYLEWRDRNVTFERMAAYDGDCASNLTGAFDAERVLCARASVDFLPVLGVAAAAGRNFTAAEDRPNSDPVALLTDGFWKRRMGSDPAALGKKLILDGKPHTIIGILPPGMSFPKDAELLLPLALDEQYQRKRERMLLVHVIGRLKNGVGFEEARANLQAIQQQAGSKSLMGQPPVISVTRLHEKLAGDARKPLLILLGAVAFVLLICCANVGNLLLARAAARREEMSMRAALGAARGRIIRQLLTESVLLALAGGAAGILVAAIWIEAIQHLRPAGIAHIGRFELNLWALGAALAISLAAAILFGLTPALSASKTDAIARSRPGTQRFRSILVASEIAMALVLLAGAGLLIRSFLRLASVPTGYQPEGVLSVAIELPQMKYGEGVRQRAFYGALLERVRGLPGVQYAAVTNSIPLTNYTLGGDFEIEGRPPFDKSNRPMVAFNAPSEDYFRVLAIPLIEGRFFDGTEAHESPPVVLVNQSFANRFFPGESAVGKRISRFGQRPHEKTWAEIIGVVGDVRHEGLDQTGGAEVYYPWPQFLSHRKAKLVLRVQGSPGALAEAVRQQVRDIDKDQPVFDVRTMEDRISEWLAPRRFNLALMSAFALIAVVLAAVGIYGVMSYAVAQRTREIGIRVALGASRRDVLRLVLGRTAMLAGAGLIAGLAGALALTRLLESLLFEIKPADPPTLIGVSLLLAWIALAASYIPARRALRVEAMTALRYE